MISHQQSYAKYLTYGGTLPLIICALDWHVYEALNARFFANCYGSVIISFLSGIHWAIYLFFFEKCPRNLLLRSNATALIAWISLLAYPLFLGFFLQILCFLYLLWLDLELERVGVLPQWFYQLRRNATTVVVLVMIAIMGSL
jgi:hypothetical protein